MSAPGGFLLYMAKSRAIMKEWKKKGDFTERVPLSYACCVTFISSEAPPGN